jgi:hypothetical protein
MRPAMEPEAPLAQEVSTAVEEAPEPVVDALSEPEPAVEDAPPPEPAVEEPPPPPPPAAPASVRERGRMRARIRYLRRLRELQIRDIGGFVLEQHRFGRARPDLVEEKVMGAAQTDAELRAPERALDDNRPVGEIRQPGIGGACPDCGNVHGSTDRFCSWCGRTL